MSILQRPLFGQAAVARTSFLTSGDGKVTQKDILIGRGVLPRKMQEGGMAAMMPPTAPVPPPMMSDPAPMPPEMPMQEPLDGPAQDMLSAREEGEKLGLDYLAATMDGIDDAANTEELINNQVTIAHWQIAFRSLPRLWVRRTLDRPRSQS